MIFYLLLAFASASSPVKIEERQGLLCNQAVIREQKGVYHLTAVLDFDGLEHVFISSLSCPGYRSIEVVSGFTLSGQRGTKLYDDLLTSAKRSRPGKKYVVLFTGNILIRERNDGDLVADITCVSKSEIKLLKSLESR